MPEETFAARFNHKSWSGTWLLVLARALLFHGQTDEPLSFFLYQRKAPHKYPDHEETRKRTRGSCCLLTPQKSRCLFFCFEPFRVRRRRYGFRRDHQHLYVCTCTNLCPACPAARPCRVKGTTLNTITQSSSAETPSMQENNTELLCFLYEGAPFLRAITSVRVPQQSMLAGHNRGTAFVRCSQQEKRGDLFKPEPHNAVV